MLGAVDFLEQGEVVYPSIVQTLLARLPRGPTWWRMRACTSGCAARTPSSRSMQSSPGGSTWSGRCLRAGPAPRRPESLSEARVVPLVLKSPSHLGRLQRLFAVEHHGELARVRRAGRSLVGTRMRSVGDARRMKGKATRADSAPRTECSVRIKDDFVDVDGCVGIWARIGSRMKVERPRNEAADRGAFDLERCVHRRWQVHLADAR